MMDVFSSVPPRTVLQIVCIIIALIVMYCGLLCPAFPPLSAYVTLLALFCISRIFEAQLYGVVLAFHACDDTRKGCHMSGRNLGSILISMKHHIPKSSRLV